MKYLDLTTTKSTMVFLFVIALVNCSEASIDIRGGSSITAPALSLQEGSYISDIYATVSATGTCDDRIDSIEYKIGDGEFNSAGSEVSFSCVNGILNISFTELGVALGFTEGVGGSNSVTFRTVASGIRSTDVTVSIEYAPYSNGSLSTGLRMEINSARDKLYILNDAANSILEIDLSTGTETTISSPSRGSGDVWEVARGLVLSGDETKLYVCDIFEDRIFEVDISTGDRSEVSNASNSGPIIGRPFDLAIDSAANLIYVADYQSDSSNPLLYTVDLNTGDRQTISGNGVGGSSNPFNNLAAVILDSAKQYAYILDVGLDSVIRVDLSDGTRTIISDGLGVGSGTLLQTPADMVFSEDESTLYVTDVNNALDAIIAVDISTGDRTVLSNSSNGGGENFGNPYSIALGSNNTAYVVDSELDTIFRVDLSTGDRTLISDPRIGTTQISTLRYLSNGPSDDRVYILGNNTIEDFDLTSGSGTVIASGSVGSGEAMTFSSFVNYNPLTELVYITITTFNRILELNPTTGVRSVHSSSGVGAGDSFGVINSSYVISEATQTGYIMNFTGDSLIEVDLSNGNRTTVSSSSVGSGTNFSATTTTAISNDGTKAFVGDRDLDCIFEVDLATGNRTIIASSSVGSGDLLVSPESIAVSADGETLYVADSGAEAVIKINMTTGERETVSGVNKGLGPSLSAPKSVILNSEETHLIVLDINLGAIIEIHIPTGNRVTKLK